jgi:hypothetical protein
LGKLSIGKIVGKMPIIHLFGKAFNSQNCRGLSIRLEKFSIGKNCRENAILHLFGKVFNWQIEGKMPSSP